MLFSLPESNENLVCFKAIGKLTVEDYHSLVEAFTNILGLHDTVRLYLDLQDLEGWEWQISWDVLKFSIKYWSKMEQIALIGTDRWAYLGEEALWKFTDAGVRFFGINEKEQALDWVTSIKT